MATANSYGILSIIFLNFVYIMATENSYGILTIFSPILEPVVSAYQMDHEYLAFDPDWNDTEKAPSTTSKTNFTVRQFVILGLLCVAGYPVEWFKDGSDKPFQNQERIYNPSLDTWAPWLRYSNNSNNGSQPSSTINAIEQYYAIMWLNVTTNDTRTYSCAEPTLGGQLLTETIVNLNVDTTPFPGNDSRIPQILQAVFTNFPIVTASPISFPFVYFAPVGGAKYRRYFLLPDGGTMESLDTFKNNISMKEKNLTQTIRKCSLIIERPTKEHRGIYKFIIETRLENGFLAQQERSFNLEFLETDRNAAETILSVNNDVLHPFLQLGHAYVITLFIKILTMVDIQIYVRSTTNCEYHLLMSDKAKEECGIIGATAGVYGKGLSIVLQAVKACKISFKWLTNGTVESAEFSFFIVSNENQAKKEFMERNNQLNEFEIVSSFPFIESLDRNVKSGNDLLVSKSLTLRCLVPVCDSYAIRWCKLELNTDSVCGPQWYNNENEREPHAEREGIDPTIDVTYHSLDSFMDAYDMTFNKLTTNHSGTYLCQMKRSWIKKDSVLDTYVGINKFQLTVKNPTVPKFEDSNENQTKKEFMERNKARNLECKLEGFPKPNISWRKYIQDGKILQLNQYSNNVTMQIEEEGDYECRGKNDFGETFRKFLVQYNDASLLPLVAIPAAVLLILLAIGTGLWLKRRANTALFKDLAKLIKESPDDVQVNVETPLNDQTDILPYNRNYEIDRNSFTLSELIGDGEFGQVYKGELKRNENDAGRLVAIKVPKDPQNTQHYRALIAEFKIMTFIQSHVNVVALVGARTTEIENKQLYLLTEFCELGSLENYLSKHWQVFESFALNSDGDSNQGTSSTIDPLLSYAYQAANGMEYLAVENIIHRDLALRNLLLTSKHVVKISDFGLSRRHQSFYEKRLTSKDPVPLWWTALEALMHRRYTQKSEVWSFGVVLWEMFSCRTPYDEHKLDFESLIYWLLKGNRLAKPRIASEDLYKLMLDCWKENPDARPSFSECKRRIGRHLEQKSPSMYATVQKNLSDAWRNLSSAPLSTTNDCRDNSELADNSLNHSTIENTEPSAKPRIVLTANESLQTTASTSADQNGTLELNELKVDHNTDAEKNPYATGF